MSKELAEDKRSLLTQAPEYQLPPSYNSYAGPHAQFQRPESVAISLGQTSSTAMQPVVVIVQQPQQALSLGAILFILGFIFAPVWWIGSCIAVSHDSREVIWKRLNIVMSLISIVVILINISLIMQYAGMDIPM